MSRTATRAHHYLPNFGSFAMAARFIIFAELLAIIITIGRNHIFDEQAWQELSLLSAFALTIAFCSIVVLKLASPLLRRLPPPPRAHGSPGDRQRGPEPLRPLHALLPKDGARQACLDGESARRLAPAWRLARRQ